MVSSDADDQQSNHANSRRSGKDHWKSAQNSLGTGTARSSTATLSLNSILAAKRDGVNRSVRMASNAQEYVEKWVYSHEAAEKKHVLRKDLFVELTSSELKDPLSPMTAIVGTNQSTWYHLYGNDEESVAIVGEHFGLRTEDIAAANTPSMDGPQVQFVKGKTREQDYLFIICHELRLAYGDGDGQPSPGQTMESSNANSSLVRRFSSKGNIRTSQIANHHGQDGEDTTQEEAKNKDSAKHRDSIWVASRQLELEEVQIGFFFIPDKKVVVSVGLSSQDSPVLEAARQNLENRKSALRQDCSKGNGCSTLIVVMLDALMDTLLPTLDLYGDVLEGVGVLMSANPDQSYVRFATKLKTRLNQIRRYTWDSRGIFLELQQDMHGVLNGTTRVQTLIQSTMQIERETAAYLQTCGGIEDYYTSFQQARMSSTIYTLTTATISVMPIQILTGVWGMNFEYMPELQWEYGYTMFRCLAGFIMLFAIIYIGRAHLIATRGTVVVQEI